MEKGLTVQTDNPLHAGKMYCVVEQIEIYSVDSIIQPSYNHSQ